MKFRVLPQSHRTPQKIRQYIFFLIFLVKTFLLQCLYLYCRTFIMGICNFTAVKGQSIKCRKSGVVVLPCCSRSRCACGLVTD